MKHFVFVYHVYVLLYNTAWMPSNTMHNLQIDVNQNLHDWSGDELFVIIN